MDMMKIGFIGLGVMGYPMAGHILKSGYPLYINTRTKEKASGLLEAGAHWCENAKEVSENADVTITIVGFPQDVERVYLGQDGLLEGAHDGSLFIDMSTTKPSLDIKINKELRKKGARLLDAPVSGGDVGARNATLSIMVGGRKDDFDKVLPLLSVLGKNINYEGEVGSGQHTKMANQIVIAGTMIGVSEALVYAKKAGLDLELMVKTISKGAAGCWTLDNLAPRVINGDFNPGFMIEHFVKDMRIAIEESRAMGLNLPGLRLVEDLYEKLAEEGMGKNGTQALTKAIEELSGVSEA